MSWTPITQEQIVFGQQVALWIRTAKKAGYSRLDGEEWWPEITADFAKSALLERIRSGKKPLAEPPPLGMACPWYALVEDPGPHYVFDVHLNPEFLRHRGDTNEYIYAVQNPYIIVEGRGERDFIVRDAYHKDTSYRFRLWFDPDWRHPNGQREPGGWFIRNIAFDHARQQESGLP